MTDNKMDTTTAQKASNPAFRKHQKDQIADIEITENITNQDVFFQKKMERVFAVKRCFTKASFKQAIIKDCYFRNCEFVECDFTGAHISGSNFQGAKFDGCDFSYTTFDKSEIGLDILSHNLPPHENLKRDLARTLRTNYESVGNYEGVNSAILVELSATLEHYRKAAFSPESHYRKKHKGLERLKFAYKYIAFWLMDKLWGNGERPWRLAWVAIVVWLLGTAYGVTKKEMSFADASLASAKCFVLGSAEELGATAAIPLTLAQYVIFGMFLASLVKRLARR